MAYPKDTSSVAKNWFEKALNLQQGESLYIPCETKSKQGSLKTRLYGARKEYSLIDPIAAEEISFSPVYREDSEGVSKPYIKAYKSSVEADKGFIKGADGVVREVTINTNKDRTRKILLLIEEGKTQEEVATILGTLSQDELNLFKKEETK